MIRLLCLSLLLTTIANAAPTLSPYAGDMRVNEIALNNNNIEYVELVVLQTVTTTGWTLHVNSTGKKSSQCAIDNDIYQAGRFLLFDGPCFTNVSASREVYILDGNGHLVHFVSLWQGNQNKGSFGDPSGWPQTIQDAALTDLNDRPSQQDNYCALIDGEVAGEGWGDGCAPTPDNSNNSNQPVCEAVFQGAATARSEIHFLDDSYIDNGGETVLQTPAVSNQGNVPSCFTADCQASGVAPDPMGLPPFEATTSTAYANTSIDAATDGSEFNFVQVTDNFSISGNPDAFHINILQIAAGATLTLVPGDYYISTFEVGAAANINLAGSSGLVRLFIQGDIEIGDSVLVNMNGAGSPGQANRLFIATYGDYHQSRGSEVAGNIYARNTAYMGTPKQVGGNLNAPTFHYGSVSADIIEYSNKMRSITTGDPINTGGICIEEDLSPTLIAHWPFDQGSDQFANSVIANAFITVNSGGSRTPDGAVCSALAFNGSNQPAANTNWAASDASPNGSLGVWVRLDGTSASVLTPGGNRIGLRITGIDASDNLSNQVIELGLPTADGNTAWVTASHTLTNTDLRQWQHIAASWQPSGNDYQIWLNGAPLTIQAQPAANITLASDLNLSMGDSGEVFAADELNIFTGIISQSEVDQLLNVSRNCPSDIDEIRLIHNPTALTCSSEPVRVEAWQNGQLKTNFNGDITLNTAPGQWLASDGSLLAIANGLATLSFDGSEGGAQVVNLSQPQVGDYVIEASSGGITASSAIRFAATGLRLLDDSGTAINANNRVHPAGSELAVSVEVVTMADNSRACQQVYPEADNIELSFASQCVNPGSCLVPVRAGQGTLSEIPNPQATKISGEQSWTLNEASLASGAVQYGDVGEINLRLSSPIADGEVISGSANLLFTPASLELVDWQTLAGSNLTSTPTAGEGLTARVVARNIQGEVAANFGNELSIPEITLEAIHVAPAGGSLGTFTDPLAWQKASAAGVFPQSGSEIRYDDVGTIDLTIALPNGYLGEPWSTTDSTQLGRFIPKQLDVTASGFQLNATCANFAYLGQPLTTNLNELDIIGLNAQGTPTPNYQYALQAGVSLAPPTISWQAGVTSTGSPSLTSAYINSGIRYGLVDEVVWPRSKTQLTAPLMLATDVIQDSDGVCYQDINGICQGVTASSNAIDHYYGRWLIDNASGPVQSNLFVEAPYRIERFDQDSGEFITNTADQCTPAPTTIWYQPGVCSGSNGFTADCRDLAIANEISPIVDGEGSYRFVGNGEQGVVEVLLEAPLYLQDTFGEPSMRSDRALIEFGAWSGQAPILYKLPGWR